MSEKIRKFLEYIKNGEEYSQFKFSISEESYDILQVILNKTEETIDEYCLFCKSNSVFQFYNYEDYISDEDFKSMPIINLHCINIEPIERDNIFETDTQKEERKKEISRFANNRAYEAMKDNLNFFNIYLNCTRNPEHLYCFNFKIEFDETNGIITKIGQYPQKYKLSYHSIEKYRKLLDSYFIELQTAIRLHSVGVGVGAFVYLRRIFENLIFNTYEEKKSELSVNEDDFKTARMNDKIKYLSAYLPDFLVENASIYGIMSKGIHKLSEEECLINFDIVQKSIEMILNEILAKQEDQKLREDLTKELSKINSK